jgi:hypothetical protein
VAAGAFLPQITQMKRRRNAEQQRWVCFIGVISVICG